MSAPVTVQEMLQQLGPPGVGREWGHWCPCGGYTKLADAQTPHCTFCGAPFVGVEPSPETAPL